MTEAALVNDDWLGSAVTDSGMVAELLVRLKQAKVAPAVLANPAVAALRWGIRQPRSRPLRCDAILQSREGDSAKNESCSPTTPLSWSGGGCGGSGGGLSSPSTATDGYEATSHQTISCLAAGSRSKVLVTDGSTNAGSKRLRRKAFAELKEEESMVLKERVCLRKLEIATSRATLKEESTIRENFKRMKDSCATEDDSGKDSSGQLHQRSSSSLDQISTRAPRQASADDNHLIEKTACVQDSVFLLPDLNMMPSEDDSGTEALV